MLGVRVRRNCGLGGDRFVIEKDYTVVHEREVIEGASVYTPVYACDEMQLTSIL